VSRCLRDIGSQSVANIRKFDAFLETNFDFIGNLGKITRRKTYKRGLASFPQLIIAIYWQTSANITQNKNTANCVQFGQPAANSQQPTEIHA
jgi:hypothetical protein